MVVIITNIFTVQILFLFDFIEIDNDVSRNRESGYYFGNICEVRINCRYVCGHSHKEYDVT